MTNCASKTRLIHKKHGNKLYKQEEKTKRTSLNKFLSITFFTSRTETICTPSEVEFRGERRSESSLCLAETERETERGVSMLLQREETERDERTGDRERRESRDAACCKQKKIARN